MGKQVGPLTRTGGGSIVFTGSAIAHKGYANHDVMAAAKGAVAGRQLPIVSMPVVLALQGGRSPHPFVSARKFSFAEAHDTDLFEQELFRGYKIAV